MPRWLEQSTGLCGPCFDCSCRPTALQATIELTAAPNQYLLWQLSVVDIFRAGKGWSNISNIRVSYTALTDGATAASGGRSGGQPIIPVENLTCFNIDGVDQAGSGFTIRPFINLTLGSLLPLWLGVNTATAGQFCGQFCGHPLVVLFETPERWWRSG